LAENDAVLAIVEEGTKLGFRSQCNNKFQNDRICVKSAIQFDGFANNWPPSHEEMATRTAASFALQKVRHVRMDIHDHI
jgi:hypothetical protein